jgi:peptide/nickel transport system substrate-binding protein
VRSPCRIVRVLAASAVLLFLAACRTPPRDPHTLVFLIESSPANLDPRIGTDAQSEHIDELLFDGLVQRDRNFRFTPALAQSWDQPDPRTLVFHLRPGIHFADSRPLTSADVAFTLNSMRSGAIVTAKAAAYAAIATIETPDPLTVTLRLKQPDNFLLTNLSTGAMGIVPAGSGKDFWQNPIGTGPFRFVSQQIDQNVLIERNPQSWSVTPSIERVRFSVVPDAITMALELQKGSADLAVNSLPSDAISTLAARPNLAVEDSPGTVIQYLGFNLRDPILSRVEVRQAIAFAIDRDLIVQALLHGRARLASSLLPPNHWAYASNVALYPHDPARANALLDQAGLPRDANGVRFHLTMKTSTDENTRVLAAALQQQFAQAGIALDLRSYEFATFYSDVTRGAFQLYSLRWIGGNEQPDIFSYAFSSARFSPKGANRGHYSNPELDRLLDHAAQVSDPALRRQDYVRAQQILAQDLPAINLWYSDTVVVHNRRLTNVHPSPSGSFAFLESAALSDPPR